MHGSPHPERIWSSSGPGVHAEVRVAPAHNASGCEMGCLVAWHGNCQTQNSSNSCRSFCDLLCSFLGRSKAGSACRVWTRREADTCTEKAGVLSWTVPCMECNWSITSVTSNNPLHGKLHGGPPARSGKTHHSNWTTTGNLEAPKTCA